MRYQQFPFIGSKTNRLIIYDYEDLTVPDYPYHHEDGRFTPIQGATSEDSFNSTKTVLPPLPGFVFDACVDFEDYRRNSYRGRRRSHALHLTANYRRKNVLVFEKWLDDEALESFKVIINKLRALVQGMRVSFASSQKGQFFYQINQPIMESIYRDLEEVRKRTMQLNRGREEDMMELPIWSDSKLEDVYKGVYNKNDWEMLAATFRQEVETFLLAAIYCNYDFQPAELEKESQEEEEEYCEPFVPKDLSPEVVKLLEDSIRIVTRHSLQGSPVLSGTHVGPSTMTSVHWQDPHSTVFNIEAEDDGGQGEPLSTEEVISSTPHKFPISDLPRGPSVSKDKVPSFTSPSIVPSLPAVPVQPTDLSPKAPVAEVSYQQFAPIDPVGKQNIIPDFQVEQIDRMYQAPPEDMEPVVPGTGTTSFNNLFKPSRFAEENSTQVETPGRVRSAYSSGLPERESFTVPSVPSNLSASRIESSVPSLLTRPSGFGHQHLSLPSIGPGGPPDNDPDDPDDPGGPNGPPGRGRHPDRPPRRPPDGSRPGDVPDPPSPRKPPSGGPPEPPDPPAGGATASPEGKPNKDLVLTGANKYIRTNETHFDTKLKPDIVPTWDGNDSTIIRWLTQVDELAQRSASVFKGLGDIVPTRFKDRAASWWFSLPSVHRQIVTENWDTLKKEIRAYWMNQSWIEKAQIRANRCRYRESGHSSETPTEYVIRKLELLAYVYNYTPSQTMSEILLKAPRMWSTVVNPRNYKDLASFQTAIKYHEDLLIDLGDKYDRYSSNSTRSSTTHSRSYRVDSTPQSKKIKGNDSKRKPTRSYAVGWSNPKHTYPHPKDDSNVSKGKTPADYGARGCIYCGSTKHWDRECKHHKSSNVSRARAMFADCSPEDMHAEAEYERCYQESLEEESESEDNQAEEPEKPESVKSEESSEEEHRDF
jgi:hypothetical protein